ncbi:Proteasome subunit alpha [Streptomyces griseoloalbus]
MADRAEYARKGIARGRSLVVLQYADGIVFVGENPSRALHKFSEIYDRIGFAAAGKYNEYENLRIGGVRYADLRGYTYDRGDVTARGLANVYAQTLGTIFSSVGEKPYRGGAGGGRGRGAPAAGPDLPAAARWRRSWTSTARWRWTRSRSAGTSTSGTGPGCRWRRR